jgi:2-polyprenyl-3-methyl-5-hydroxy-6-metoxy-1,4-benzoquinol methylase
VSRPPRSYDPREYWSALHAEPGLRAVGQSGLPEGLNVWLYRIGRRNVTAFLAAHGIGDLSGKAVLDVGSGTGFWIDLWIHMGAAVVDGTDLIPAATERLRERYPASTFFTGDIADPGVVPDQGRYDLVAVMNVMLHILDEDRFAASAANVAAAVRPGGRLFLAEPALTRSAPKTLTPGASSTARPLKRYSEVLERAGLHLIAVGPSTVVGANPIESGDSNFRRYSAIWKRAGRWARRWPRAAGLIGLILAALDRILMRTGAAPSGKLIMFERPAAGQTRSP